MNIAVRGRRRLTTSTAGFLIAAGLLAIPGSAAAATFELTASDVTVGETIQATATLSDGVEATGTIEFEVFAPGDPSCSNKLVPGPAAATVDGDGSYLSGTFPAAKAGDYLWSAHYLGDVNNPAIDLNCVATSTVAKASPTLEGNASDGVVGGTIKDEATLTGAFSPSEEVTFSVFAPNDLGCTTPLDTGTSPLSGATAVSADFTTAAAGEYRWVASYPGDANNEAVSTPCGAASQFSDVAKLTPGLAATATASVLVGNPIKDSVVFSGGFEAGGQLTFRAFGPGDPTCAGSAVYEEAVTVDGNGTYAPTGFTPAPGTYLWTVSYSGDDDNTATATTCGAANQTSTVNKRTPLLTGTATSAVQVGLPITDAVTFSGGLDAGGQLTFRAYGPGDQTCANPPAYEEAVTVAGDGSYEPAGFVPAAGLYLWTVTYGGDENNAAVTLPCGSANQASAVGILNVTLAASAGGGTVGGSLTATATIGNGATPGGQLTFEAFPPGDATCSGTAAFSSTVTVAGNGSYSSTPFSPAEVGTYRWAIHYSGDANHAAADVACGAAASPVGKAAPTVTGKVAKRLAVGTKFRDSVVLAGSYAASGTITFQIYGPGASADRCDRPAFVNTIKVNGNGTYNSDPFVAKKAGRYRFLAIYSGDARNEAATESCAAAEQLAQVKKRTPKVLPLAALVRPQQISVRARLSGASSPSGAIAYRLFAPGDRRCSGRPALSGSLRIAKNGTFNLAQYIATKPGQYRLAVAYSGDPRNASTRINCRGAKLVTVRG